MAEISLLRKKKLYDALGINISVQLWYAPSNVHINKSTAYGGVFNKYAAKIETDQQRTMDVQQVRGKNRSRCPIQL